MYFHESLGLLFWCHKNVVARNVVSRLLSNNISCRTIDASDTQ